MTSRLLPIIAVCLLSSVTLAGDSILVDAPVMPLPDARQTASTPYDTPEPTRLVDLDRHDPNGTRNARASHLEHVRLFLVQLDDHGVHGDKIGCGDSLVPVDVLVAGHEPLRAALTALLSTPASRYGTAYYSALDHSSLRIDHLSVKNGVARVKLTGTLALGGTCDSPRLSAQLRQTVLQFDRIREAEISINGKPLEALTQMAQ